MTDLDRLDALAAAAINARPGADRMRAVLAMQKITGDAATIRELVAAVRERDELREAAEKALELAEDAADYGPFVDTPDEADILFGWGERLRDELGPWALDVRDALRAALRREAGT